METSPPAKSLSLGQWPPASLTLCLSASTHEQNSPLGSSDHRAGVGAEEGPLTRGDRLEEQWGTVVTCFIVIQPQS